MPGKNGEGTPRISKHVGMVFWAVGTLEVGKKRTQKEDTPLEGSLCPPTQFSGAQMKTFFRFGEFSQKSSC